MSVITKDTIQPSSGQALTIKDEGGTASITVATNGEATFAENIKITNGKGIDFSAVSGSASGSSSSVLDNYEEGTWTPIIQANGAGGDEIGEFTVNSCTYTKIGNRVFLTCKVTESGGAPSNPNAITFKNLPFVSTQTNWNCVGSASTNAYGNSTVLNDNFGDNIININHGTGWAYFYWSQLGNNDSITWVAQYETSS